MPIPLAAIAIGAGLAKLGVDIGTNVKRRRNFEDAMSDRPEYEIPDALENSYAEAQRQYKYGEIPGYSEAIDRIGLSQSNSLRAAQEGGNALGLVAALQSGTNRSYEDLEVRNAEFRQSNLDRVLRMSQLMSDAQDRQWQMNEFAPWADRYNFDQNMTGLWNETLTRGINNLGYGATMLGGGAGSPNNNQNQFMQGAQAGSLLSQIDLSLLTNLLP